MEPATLSIPAATPQRDEITHNMLRQVASFLVYRRRDHRLGPAATRSPGAWRITCRPAPFDAFARHWALTILMRAEMIRWVEVDNNYWLAEPTEYGAGILDQWNAHARDAA